MLILLVLDQVHSNKYSDREIAPRQSPSNTVVEKPKSVRCMLNTDTAQWEVVGEKRGLLPIGRFSLPCSSFSFEIRRSLSLLSSLLFN